MEVLNNDFLPSTEEEEERACMEEDDLECVM
jgi:hypothetical protein